MLPTPLLQDREVFIDEVDAPTDLVLAALDVATHHKVFIDRQVLEYPPALEHLGDAMADDVMRRAAIQTLAVELDRTPGDLAAFGMQQARDRLQSCRLASAV